MALFKVLIHLKCTGMLREDRDRIMMYIQYFDIIVIVYHGFGTLKDLNPLVLSSLVLLL